MMKKDKEEIKDVVVVSASATAGAVVSSSVIENIVESDIVGVDFVEDDVIVVDDIADVYGPDPMIYPDPMIDEEESGDLAQLLAQLDENIVCTNDDIVCVYGPPADYIQADILADDEMDEWISE